MCYNERRKDLRLSVESIRKQRMKESYNQSEEIFQKKEELLKCRTTDSRRVLEICEDLEKYALEREEKELLGFTLFYRGEAYYILNDIEAMFETIVRSVAYLNETGQWELLARAYNIMAITSINRGHIPVAVDYYLYGLRCAKEHGDDTMLCRIRINLGYLYMQSGVYREAEHHLMEAYRIYLASPDKKTQIGRLIMIYNNLITCFMEQGKMVEAEQYMNRLTEECESSFNDMDRVYVGCMAARYYKMRGEEEKCTGTIQGILEKLDKQLPILDLFDDLYSLCELTLEIEEYDVFVKIAGMLEPVIDQTRMINLQRKLLELKIRYHKIRQEEECYLKETARFYELVMVMEEESRRMIAHMLSVRTALERANEHNAALTRKSETDPLTGLANRYRLTDVSQKMLDACRKNGALLAVEILDIDYFKEYNDNYGHQAGDECIQAVASLIREMQSDTVFCARYGGDEFIIIYSGNSRQEVMERALKLREDIIGLRIEHAHSKAFDRVTISQGICQAVPTEGNKSWDFLHVADEYLYRVKKQKRNSICFEDIKGNAEILK